MNQSITKLVVLDRDGVINEDSDEYVKSAKEWIPIDGSIDAIVRLTNAGYLVAVATNQSGLARGYFTQNDLEAMHKKLLTLVTEKGGKIDYIAHCPHGPNDSCKCRKPLPGLLNQIEEALGVSVKNCSIVGDSLRDLQAGQAKGMKPILVLTGKGERTLAKNEGLEGVAVFKDLKDYVDNLLQQ